MDKLLLCPFCGKPPKTCPDTSYGEALVFCPDENECAVSPSASADLNDGETLDTAISAWNTRSLSPAPEGVDARELLAAAIREDGIEPPPALFTLPLDKMADGLGTLWPRALRAIDAALALSRPPAEQVRMREALEEATEAIGVCIDGFEKSNPTLGGLAAIHMLKEARERYRTILALTPPPKGQNDG